MPDLTDFLARVRSKPMRSLLRMAPQYTRTEIARRAISTYYWCRLHATPSDRSSRRRNAIRQLRDAETLLFLCHGSICRSPFAERYARTQLSDRGIDGIDVTSAGLVELDDPRSPAAAQDTAETYDIDLADHQSVKATANAIEAADLILLMDYRNYHNFTTSYPDAAERTFLLRIFEPGPRMQITDPYGYNHSVFDSVYGDIAACIRALIDEYEAVSCPKVANSV